MGMGNNEWTKHISDNSHHARFRIEEMQSSLSFKILLRIGAAVGCCVFLLGFVEVHQTRMHIHQNLESDLAQTGLRLSRSLVMPVWNIDKDVIQNIVYTEMQDRNIEAVLVRDNLTESYFVAKGRDDYWGIIDVSEMVFLKASRSTDLPIIYNNEEIGRVRVAVTDKFSQEESVAKIAWLIARLVVLLLLVLAVLIFFINTLISKPIVDLSRNCKKVAMGDFNVELETSREDEIGGLAKSFADMRDGIREYIAELNTEIWERKRSESELTSLRTSLSNIIDSMPSILFTVDKTQRVTQWNLQAEKITGVDRASARGKVFYEVLPALIDETDLVEDVLVNNSLRSAQRVSMQLAGAMRIVDIFIYPLMADYSEGAVVRLDDVTDRVKIEEVMVQTEKMMSVGGLAAGMAHEINNPLAGIMQSAQVIQNRLLPDLNKNKEVAAQCGITMEQIDCYQRHRDIDKMLHSLLESGSRAARIITNMLSFSRKSSSKFMYCDIGDLLDTTLDLAANDYDLKKKYDFRKIEIVRNYDSTVDKIRCDAGAIQQVFLNLLKNAAQAMVVDDKQDGDNVPTSAKPKIILRIYQDRQNLNVEFSDNGIGMDEDTVKRIFEPFYSTKEVGVGTGLGLSVSYFIVKENHSGSIKVRSTRGTGTTFTVSLPRPGN
jgi:PAS domain S-box-containing protein